MGKLSFQSQSLRCLFLITFIGFPFYSNAQFSPVISDIPDQQIQEGELFAEIDLNAAVSDPDNDNAQLSLNHLITQHLIVNIQNNIATVLTPDENWNGSEEIAFIVTDPDMHSDTDNARFTVTPVNDAPVVGDIPGQSVPEGSPFAAIHLDEYVTDVDNLLSDITWSRSVSSKLNVDSDAGHVATVLPAGTWTGSETLTFTATDASDASASDDAVFTIQQVESLPVAVNDSYTVDEGGSISTPAPGVLSNDSDADGDLLSAVRVTDPSHANSFNVNGDGSFTYVHDGSSASADAFTYVADDGKGQSTAATVNITVNPVNDNPVITDIPDVTINEGGNFNPISLNEFVSDEETPDNLLSWIATGNSNLNVEINDVTHVATVKAPTKKWNGSETLTFTVTDPQSGTDSDNASFNVLGVQEAPVTVADAYTVNEGAALTITAPGVLSNDTDGDGDPLTAVLVAGPSNGSSFSLNADGSFSYTHNGSETTTDAFTYYAFDGTSPGNTVTVTITINPVNDPPVTSDIPNQTINEEASFATINLDGYVTDPDNADNEITWTYSGNSSLSVSISPARVATITTPGTHWFGTETITFNAADPSNANSSDAATFTVNSLNDPPVLAGIETTALDYPEGSGPVQVTSTLTVTDVDNVIASAIVSISGNYLSDQDVLSFTNAFGITGSFNSSTGILTLTGSTSPGNYQLALRSVKYTNTSLSPSTLLRTVSFTV